VQKFEKDPINHNVAALISTGQMSYKKKVHDKSGSQG
jgi:hypothetical protein